MFNNFGSGAFLSATLLKNSNAKHSVGHNHPLGGAKQVDTGGGFEYCWSGCSQGIPEPAAHACAIIDADKPKVSATSMVDVEREM